MIEIGLNDLHKSLQWKKRISIIFIFSKQSDRRNQMALEFFLQQFLTNSTADPLFLWQKFVLNWRTKFRPGKLMDIKKNNFFDLDFNLLNLIIVIFQIFWSEFRSQKQPVLTFSVKFYLGNKNNLVFSRFLRPVLFFFLFLAIFCKLISLFGSNWLLTESGKYPQLPTQPKFFVHFSI